jgi:D-inositol-3-phosphate glycosyltransferase
VRVKIVGNRGRGGHARYCDTLAAALATTGTQAELLGPEPYISPWYTRYAVSRFADRSIRHAYHMAHVFARIARTAPEVVHFQVAVPVLDWTWIPAVRARCATVLTVHNVEPHTRDIVNHPGFTRKVLRAMDALIVHSEVNRKRLLEVHPEVAGRVHVVRHGVWEPAPAITKAEARGRLGIPLGRRVVLFFGALRANKGLPLLLDAVSVLSRRSPDRRPLILIAGKMPSGASFEAYADRIRAAGLAPDVVARVGFVPDNEVSAYYAAADVVALPYEEGFQAQSGVLMEAYGYDSPVVVTDVGALGETVRADRTGVVVTDRRSPEAFASALESALWNDDLRNAVGSQMETLRRGKYSWGVVASETRRVYEWAVSSRANRHA